MSNKTRIIYFDQVRAPGAREARTRAAGERRAGDPGPGSSARASHCDCGAGAGSALASPRVGI